MDRWIIIGAVLAIFACLGVGGLDHLTAGYDTAEN